MKKYKVCYGREGFPEAGTQFDSIIEAESHLEACRIFVTNNPANPIDFGLSVIVKEKRILGKTEVFSEKYSRIRFGLDCN
jgi:hypothetical protein